jgi:hypothetical protein
MLIDKKVGPHPSADGAPKVVNEPVVESEVASSEPIDQTEAEARKKDLALVLEENKKLQDSVNALLAKVNSLTNTPAASSAPQLPGVVDITTLLGAILKREERITRTEEKQFEMEQARQKQRDKNREASNSSELLPQTTCSHLKGGKFRKKRNVATDYAVYHHTFVDGEQRITCMLCNMHWGMKDTKEQLFRRGKYIPNHTKLGWSDAVFMFNNSSNTASRSEIPATFAARIHARSNEAAAEVAANESKVPVS